MAYLKMIGGPIACRLGIPASSHMCVCIYIPLPPSTCRSLSGNWQPWPLLLLSIRIQGGTEHPTEANIDAGIPSLLPWYPCSHCPNAPNSGFGWYLPWLRLPDRWHFSKHPHQRHFHSSKLSTSNPRAKLWIHMSVKKKAEVTIVIVGHLQSLSTTSEWYRTAQNGEGHWCIISL